MGDWRSVRSGERRHPRRSPVVTAEERRRIRMIAGWAAEAEQRRAQRTRFIWELSVAQFGIPFGVMFGSVALLFVPIGTWFRAWMIWYFLVAGLTAGSAVAYVVGSIVWARRERSVT